MKRVLVIFFFCILLPLGVRAADSNVDVNKDAEMLVKSSTDLKSYISYLATMPDKNNQAYHLKTYTEPLVKGSKITIQQKYVINNFLVYGTKNLKNINRIEDKIEAIKWFKQKNKKLPISSKDWVQVINKVISIQICIKRPDDKIIPVGYKLIYTKKIGECISGYIYSNGLPATSTEAREIWVSFYNALSYDDFVVKTKKNNYWTVHSEYKYKGNPVFIIQHTDGVVMIHFIMYKYKNGYINFGVADLNLEVAKGFFEKYVDGLSVVK
ncbi:MAG: hypothetical protein WCK11_00125 [Candidatus Falkowbacteria bacterium]